MLQKVPGHVAAARQLFGGHGASRRRLQTEAPATGQSKGDPNLSFITLLSMVVRTAVPSLAEQRKQNPHNNIIIIIMIRIKSQHTPGAQARCPPADLSRYAILKKCDLSPTSSPLCHVLAKSAIQKSSTCYFCRIKQKRLCAPYYQKRGLRRVTTCNNSWMCPPGSAWSPWNRLCPSRCLPPRG